MSRKSILSDLPDNRATRSPDDVGVKATGLFALPEEWTPPFFVVAADLHEAWKINEFPPKAWSSPSSRFQRELRRVAEGRQLVIVRSSSLGEDWIDRGLYESKLAVASPNDVLKAITEIWESTDVEVSLPLIVQAAQRRQAYGHLSNERRVSKRRTEWLCELERSDATSAAKRYRVSASPMPAAELACQSLTSLEAKLKAVAASFSKQDHRAHLEWVWDGSRLWIVQFDREPPPPRSEYLAHVHAGAAASVPEELLCTLVPASEAQQDWEKARCLAQFSQHGLPTPIVFALEKPGDIRALAKGAPPRRVLDDLRVLTQGPLVIRTDIKRNEGNIGLMLPRTNTVRTVGEAAAFLTATARDLVERGAKVNEVCFLLHRFVWARSSAWVFAAPDTQRARIDGIWGLPDGLLYYPHDSFEVDLRTRKVSQRIRCKPRILVEDDDGAWVEKPAGAPLDWKPSIATAELIEIAGQAQRLAAGERRRVMVMFLVGVDPASGYPACLPWIELTDELPDLTAVTSTDVLSRPHVVVRNWDDIERLESNPPSAHKLSLRLRPVPELLRSREFMMRTAAFAATESIPIELEGSLLSHAFYLLQQHGAIVRTLDPFTPAPKKQVFEKLVRDLIPLRIKSAGEQVTSYKVTSEELLPLLKAKAVEEALEFLAADDHDSGFQELADLLEVIQSAARLYGRTAEELQAEANRKREERGGFESGVVLASTEDVPLLDIMHVRRIPGKRVPHRVSDSSRRGTRFRARTRRPPRAQPARVGQFGASLPLIPPDRSYVQADISIPLLNGAFSLQITYREKDVIVRLRPASADAEMDDGQLQLFDAESK